MARRCLCNCNSAIFSAQPSSKSQNQQQRTSRPPVPANQPQSPTSRNSTVTVKGSTRKWSPARAYGGELSWETLRTLKLINPASNLWVLWGSGLSLLDTLIYFIRIQVFISDLFLSQLSVSHPLSPLPTTSHTLHFRRQRPLFPLPTTSHTLYFRRQLPCSRYPPLLTLSISDDSVHNNLLLLLTLYISDDSVFPLPTTSHTLYFRRQPPQ